MNGNDMQHAAFQPMPAPYPASDYDLSGPPQAASHLPGSGLPPFSLHSSLASTPSASEPTAAGGKKKSRRNADPSAQKRRCVSTACVACRKRKSKCDGALPSCAACASVYCTECVYDPNSDHRRKGVYREKVDSMKAQNSTLQILIEAILNADEEDVPEIVRKIRTCDSLDEVAESIVKEESNENDGEQVDGDTFDNGRSDSNQAIGGELQLARKMGELRLENGSVRFIGGTSHLIYTSDGDVEDEDDLAEFAYRNALTRRFESPLEVPYTTEDEAINSWTTVTTDTALIRHLMNMYITWHYTYFTTLSKSLFEREFYRGRPQAQPKRTVYCTSLLVNAMLALGCHFSAVPGAFAAPGDSRTKGDHFFAEAKRLIVENDEYEKPRLTTVQALALMSVREAGCAREAKGWVYSGMSFRMAQDIGLTFDAGSGAGPSAGNANSEPRHHKMGEDEIDARRITFWGCFLFDKAWSNYLGRLPQLPKNSYSVPKYDVFPLEDSTSWAPYTDSGFDPTLQQPARTRAIGLQLSKLCEISSDLLLFFYHPNHIGRSNAKAVELKKLSELHRRLENWRNELPKEFEPREGQLPNVMLTHMFYHLQYIHLFRPFLKYSPNASPLPSHVSPRRICTANACSISKVMRQYKKTYNLRQICNIAVYMIHSACTIHLLNLPEKTAKRNIIHGVKQLEEIAEDWLCARRTLSIISVLARKWGVDLPEEASQVLQRSDDKYGTYSTSDVPSPNLSVGLTSGNSGASVSPHAEFTSPEQGPVVKAEHFPSGLPSTTVPGLLEQISQQAPSFQDFSMPGVPSDYFREMAKVPSPEAGNDVASKQNALQTIRGSAGGGSGVGPMGGHVPAHLNAWAMQPGIPQTIQGYQQPLPFSQPAAPHQDLAPHMFGVDGQEWFLKDGASWQHNFEAWGLVQQQSPSPVSQLQSMHGSSNTTATSSNDATSIGDGSFYMLQGGNNADMDLPFDD